MLITFLGSSWQREHVKLIFVPDLADVQIYIMNHFDNMGQNE